MSTAVLASLTHILKRHYGPRLIAFGSYRQIVTLLELEQYERRKSERRRDFRRLAASAGCEVKRSDPMHDIMYRDSPFLALIGGKPRKPRPRVFADYEVAIGQQGRNGWRRSTFRPEPNA